MQMIADLIDPKDSEGRTYREINNAKSHAFEIGVLVEIGDGVRMFIASQTRDCDGTPLYSLTSIKEETGDAFYISNWTHGYSERGMKPV